MQSKVCSKCGEEKEITEFHIKAAHSTGRSPSCRTCDCRQKRAYWEGNKERIKESRKDYLRAYWAKPENSQRSMAKQRARAVVNPRYALRANLHNALKRRPTDNAVTVDELMAIFEAQSGCCAITGIKFVWQRGKIISPQSMTIDRIDPQCGYSADNVRLVCHAVNTFRGRMSDDEMFAMALAIVANMKRPKLRLVS